MVIRRKVGRRVGRASASARRSTVRESQSPDPVSPPSEPLTGIHSPFHLTNGNNPGAALISEVLDGSNYENWKIAMTIALDAKNKSAFIDGSLARPVESHQNFRIWSRCNSMVKSWILNSVSKQIYKSILRFNDASETWKDLEARFHITNIPRSYQLSQQIWSLQQGALDLATYFTNLKTLWDELDGATCVSTCRTCDCCKAIDKKADQAKIIKFLAGLNESYSIIRGQIIMKKNLPDLSEIYNLLDQDHSQRSFASVQNATAFQVAAPVVDQSSMANVNYHQRPNKPVCTHCGYTGHTTDTCYKIHGYPIDFKHRNKSKYEKPSSGKPQGSSKPVAAQLTLANTEIGGQSIPHVINSLTQDQIQGVIAYFNSQLQPSFSESSHVGSTSGATITALPGMACSSSTLRFIAILKATDNVLVSDSWIVDSGATHHVSCDRSRFETFCVSLHASVTLPTGMGV